MSNDPNCEFTYFKQSGKFYSEGKGYMSQKTWELWYEGLPQRTAFWQAVCDENGGTLPGLSVSCTNLSIHVRALDNSTVPPWPLLFKDGHGV